MYLKPPASFERDPHSVRTRTRYWRDKTGGQGSGIRDSERIRDLQFHTPVKIKYSKNVLELFIFWIKFGHISLWILSQTVSSFKVLPIERVPADQFRPFFRFPIFFVILNFRCTNLNLSLYLKQLCLKVSTFNSTIEKLTNWPWFLIAPGRDSCTLDWILYIETFVPTLNRETRGRI